MGGGTHGTDSVYYDGIGCTYCKSCIHTRIQNVISLKSKNTLKVIEILCC